MSNSFRVHNRQRTKPVNLRLFRKIGTTLLRELLPHESFEISVNLVGAAEMTRLNETFLSHQGSTDVLAFDYSDMARSDGGARDVPARSTCPPDNTSEEQGAVGTLRTAAGRDGPRSGAMNRCAPGHIMAEIFLCVDEALVQAGRFRTTWQSELVRYLIHGVLHLNGYDDHHPSRRRKMKREEGRLLRKLSKCFDFSGLGKPPPPSKGYQVR